jgi:hypothetical protein
MAWELQYRRTPEHRFTFTVSVTTRDAGCALWHGSCRVCNPHAMGIDAQQVLHTHTGD